MYLTEDMLNSIIRDISSERESLGEFKKRGKGRKYSSPETDTYILDTYCIFICEELKKLLKSGDYSIDRVVNHIRKMDWKSYSKEHAYSGEKLLKLLGMRYKKETLTFYYSTQSRYLERASESVSQILETYEW